MNNETEELDRWADDGGATNEDTLRESAGPLSYQVGGDHYKKYEYQPIEFFNDVRLDFNRANAIKYLARWKDKGGVEDLKKAVQYLRFMKQEQDKNDEKVFRFLEQFENPERRIIGRILYCETWKARNEIENLIQVYTDGQNQAEETPDADANLFEENETRKQ